MKARRISIEVNIEGKTDRLPYPSNAPIPRVGEWILSPANTGYILQVIGVGYHYVLIPSFRFDYDMHITINTKEHKDEKSKSNRRKNNVSGKETGK